MYKTLLNYNHVQKADSLNGKSVVVTTRTFFSLYVLYVLICKLFHLTEKKNLLREFSPRRIRLSEEIEQVQLRTHDLLFL